MTTAPPVLTRRDELSRARAACTGRVAVVMTMGALHAGHAHLMRAARAAADHVIVTIFVNPLQFGPTEDLDRYPRTLEADVDVCRAELVDIVFAPTRAEVYPGGEPAVRVTGGPAADILEGASRPGHFDGVLTVVLKLLHLTRADLAFFGDKDYQQLALIRTMVRDLDVATQIVAVPTVREPDGLALSSRNRFLTGGQRAAASALSAGLRAGAVAAQAGAAPAAVVAAVRATLDQTPSVVVDYVALTDPDLGAPPARGAARLLVAGRVGATRLIDNTAVELR